MFKQIFRTIRVQKLNYSLSETTGRHASSIPRTSKYYLPQLNLKRSTTRNIHINTIKSGKLFYDYENTYAFEIITKDSPARIVKSPTNEIKTTEEFNSTLDQNWRGSTASDIVKTFLNVKNYCVQNVVSVSDTRFDKLVDGLMDHAETLTDTELAELLSYLCELPPCESYTSHNFHDIWSCLDDVCCWKMVGWDIDTMFDFANLWFKLNLSRLCDFVFTLIDRLTKKAEQLSKDQLVKIFFYFNVCRRRAVDFEYEYALEKQINNMNIDEIAVVSLGYFKSKTKIKLLPITEAMVKKVMENSKSIHEISLTGILKILRYSKPTKIVTNIQEMLDILSDEVDRLSHVSCLHIALLSTGLQSPHMKSLQRVSEKIVKAISDVEKVRLKDIERLLHVLTMFDFVPNTETDIYEAAYNQIHAKEREKEYAQYPRCLPCALYYLSLRNIYSHKLTNMVLDRNFINDTYGKTARNVPHVLLSLDASIDIECPDYKGNRLPQVLRHKATKWLTEFTPSYDQHKKITAADKLVLETIDAIKDVVKDEQLIYVDHVLPHFSRADIVLCRDKKSGNFVKPSGFEGYTLGEVMFPKKDEALVWFAIFVLGWNNTIRESSLPLGNTIMKKRQLEKIGYKPVLVIWNELSRLSKEDKVEYISRKLN